jgi:Alkylmercury lyase
MTTTNHTSQLSSCCSIPSAEEPADTSHTVDDLGSCCSVPAPDSEKAAALDDVKGHGDSLEISALRSAGFGLLLESGRPVEIAEWAAAAHLDLDAVTTALDSHAGRVQTDDSGRLLGIAGLTVEPSRHELDIDGKQRWTWCALDAVGILGALDATGSIRSTDPRTGAAVEIEFVDGHPQGDAALFILGGYDGGNVREEWCPLVNFFTSRSDAEVWVTDNELAGDIVSVVDVAEEAAAMWRPVTDPSAPQVC